VPERRTSAVQAAILTAALGAGCGGASVIDVGGPTGIRCQASLGSLPTVAAEGGTLVVALVAARECTWQAESDASWLHVSPQSGQGSRSLTLGVSENRLLQSRTTAVTINEQQFMLTQEAPEPLLPWRRGGRRDRDDDDD